MLRAILMVLVLAVGMHHANPLVEVGHFERHASLAGVASGPGHDNAMDGLAATCLAVLTLALAVPRIRRLMVGLAARVPLVPARAWAARPEAIRGPPPRGAGPRFLLLCTLRR